MDGYVKRLKFLKSLSKYISLNARNFSVATIDPYLSGHSSTILSSLQTSQQQRLSKNFRGQKGRSPWEARFTQKNLILYKLHVILNIFRGQRGAALEAPIPFFFYGSSEVNNKKELNCFIQTVIYQNADNSIKEITRASTNENIKAIISEDDLSNVKTFTVSVEFPDIDFEKSAKDEGTITLNLKKKTDPPEEEEMLFEKDKQLSLIHI